MARVERSLERELVRDPAVRAAVREVAEQVHRRAEARAATHDRSGQFERSLSVREDGDGYAVVSTDPRAVVKEYGHTDDDTGRFVPGTYALTGAAADVAGA